MQASPADLPLEIDVHSVKAMIDTGDDFLLLDCRDVDEHQFVRIAGSVLIPVGELAGRLAELDEHRERHIVVHCHYGGRSLEANLALLKNNAMIAARVAIVLDSKNQRKA